MKKAIPVTIACAVTACTAIAPIDPDLPSYAAITEATENTGNHYVESYTFSRALTKKPQNLEYCTAKYSSPSSNTSNHALHQDPANGKLLTQGSSRIDIQSGLATIPATTSFKLESTYTENNFTLSFYNVELSINGSQPTRVGAWKGGFAKTVGEKLRKTAEDIFNCLN